MINRHHIVHNRQEWSLRKAGLWIREQPSLIQAVSQETHKEIHDNCPPIPLLGHYALLRTAHLFLPGRDTVESIDNLSFAIDEAGKHPKTHPIERAVGELAIEALQLQKPYLGDYPPIKLAA